MNRLILITGNDALAIKEKAETIINSAKEEINDEYSFEIITGDSDNSNPMKVLEELLLAINTPSFFSKSKNIWVKHFSHFNLATGKDTKKIQFQETFKDIIEILKTECLENKSVSLIIDGPELDRRTSIYKFFAKNGKVYNLDKINQNDKNFQTDVRNKIRELCNLGNVQIAYNAVEFLAATVGSDTGRLTTEISKLVSYVGDNKNITLNDCQAICSKSFEMANWVFADALSNKNIKSSFNALNIIIDKLISERSASSNPELSMLFGAIRKFQELIKIKSGAELLKVPPKCQYPFFKSRIESMKSEGETSKNNILLSYHPYRAYKLFEQSQHFTDREIADIFSVLLEANKELVSGNTAPRIVLENLILKVCT